MDKDELPLHKDWNTIIFHEVPNARLMNNFYLAARHTVTKMPRLREMVLVAENSLPEHSLTFKAIASKNSLTLNSTLRFVPRVKVLDMWREAAKKNTTDKLEIIYLTQDDI